jgi:hypothetical protein
VDQVYCTVVLLLHYTRAITIAIQVSSPRRLYGSIVAGNVGEMFTGRA